MRNPALVTEDLDGELVIFDQRDGSVHVLNGSAASIWTLIDGRRSIDGVVSEVQGNYTQDSNAIRGEVLEFLNDLELKGLVEIPSPEV